MVLQDYKEGVKTMTSQLNEHCPLCGKMNNCCYGKDKSLGICWCNQETFPHEIFELVPEKDIRVKCICKECLDRFKNGSTDFQRITK